MADEPTTTQPEEVDRISFHYIKGKNFRVIHADGALGGITPRGYVHFALYSERAAIPRRGVRNISEDGKTLGPETIVEVREGVVRELEVDVIMDEKTTIELRDWLDRRIQNFKEILEQSEKKKEVEETIEND